MRKNLPKILIFALIVLLVISNVYFIAKYMEPSISVQIGIPQFDEESKVSATYLSPVLDNEDANLVLLAFMLGRPITEEEFPTDLPHGYLVVGYQECGYPHEFWIQEDCVIFETSTESAKGYRKFQNDHNNVVPLLQELIESLKNSNFSQNNA